MQYAPGCRACSDAIRILKAKHLDPYKYLQRIFTEFPNLDFNRHLERMDLFLPWIDEMQQTCK